MKVPIRTLGGIFFISSATLCLEITLTRYFSISQNYHFAFLVISIAFLGYGASGSVLSLLKKSPGWNEDKFLPLSSWLFSLAILVSFLVSNSLPFDFLRLSWDKNQLFYIFLYYFFLSFPFFFAGLTISFAVTRFSSFVNKVYFLDLLGAGTGSFLSALIFLPKGERGVFIFISFLACFASFLFCPKKLLLPKVFLFLFLAGEVFIFFYSPTWLNFRISPFKALPLALKYPQAKLHLTKWNAISRLDVLESPAVRYAPGLSLLYGEKLPPQLGLSQDGGEMSAVTHFENIQEPDLQFLSSLPSSLAYSFVQNPRVLVIEPKGGLDVLAALFFNSSRIKVTESNPLIPRLLHKELASSSGHLYDQKNIQSVSGHLRAALKKDRESYDLIVFSLTDVFGASGTGLYGFGENYLYTLDSFTQILERLTSQGVISMTLYLLPPPRQEIKLLATWIEALEKYKKDPRSHLIAIQTWGTISYFIKKSPFQAEEIEKLKAFASERLFDLVYYPGIKVEEVNIYNKFDKPLYYDLTLELLSSSQRKELYKNYLFEIKPVTDNRPFFYNLYKSNKLKATYRALGNKWLPFLEGEFLIPLLLLQALLIAFLFILLPLLILPKTRIAGKGAFLPVFFYFSLIGAAFMFVEITLIQKFILFLGHSLYSASTVIFSLLLSSGFGSFFSRNILGQDLQKKLKKVLLLAAALIILTLTFFPLFYKNFIGLSLVWRIILTFLFIFPLGFCLGFPFPTGIRLLDSKEKRLIPWAWATNAFSSVINSVLALLVAFWGGYNSVLLLAASSYLIALPFLGFANHGNKSNA